MQLLQRPARGQLQTGRSGSHRRTCRDDRPSDVPSDPVRRNVVPDPVRDLGTSVPGLLSVVRELSAREVRGPFDIVLLDRGLKSLLTSSFTFWELVRDGVGQKKNRLARRINLDLPEIRSDKDGWDQT